jgi:hypothetical protein
MKTTSVFEGEDASGGRERGAWKRFADAVRTALVWSDARLETLTVVARREDGDFAHEVSILMRVGVEERVGRAPSNVSTMIIRPPQHGH